MEYFRSHLRRPLVVERNMPLVWLVWMIDCCHIIELPSSSAENVMILRYWTMSHFWFHGVRELCKALKLIISLFFYYQLCLYNQQLGFQSAIIHSWNLYFLEFYVLYRRWPFRESGGWPLVRSGQWPLSDVIGTWGRYSAIWYGTL